LQKKTEIQELFKTQLKKTDNSVLIVSAFITNYGFNFVNEYLNDSVREKVVIFRGRLDDFKQGATEFDFKKALNNGWKIFINLDLHAKFYIFDKEKIIAGSSNLTRGGLINNKERNRLQSFTVEDEKELSSIIESSIEINGKNIERVEEIIKKIKEVDEYSFYDLQREWKNIFYDPELKQDLELDRTDLRDKEKYFLNKRVVGLADRLLNSPENFVEKIDKNKLNYQIPEAYVINLKSNQINFKPFHFKNKVYEYLLKYYQNSSKYYREKIDLPPVSDIWYDLNDNRRNSLLNNLIQAAKGLYSKNIMLNFDFEKIYFYEHDNQLKTSKLKFAEYINLSNKAPVKKLISSYQEKLREYFGRRKIIDELRLGSEKDEQ